MMLLDKVDQSTSTGILWKPINNSTFSGYTTQGNHFGYVLLSFNSRQVFFGPLQ